LLDDAPLFQRPQRIRELCLQFRLVLWGGRDQRLQLVDEHRHDQEQCDGDDGDQYNQQQCHGEATAHVAAEGSHWQAEEHGEGQPADDHRPGQGGDPQEETQERNDAANEQPAGARRDEEGSRRCRWRQLLSGRHQRFISVRPLQARRDPSLSAW
jgi:hypothetical protein